MFGALNAGNIAKYGRKMGLYFSNFLMMTGIAITFSSNIWLFGLGKFIHGESAGFFLFFGPVYLNEFVPVIIRGTMGGTTSVLIGAGAAIPIKLMPLYSKNIEAGLFPNPNSQLTGQ